MAEDRMQAIRERMANDESRRVYCVGPYVSRLALADLAFLLGEADRLRGLLRGLLEAEKAHQETDALALRAAFNDAPDATERAQAMGATSKDLDDAWDAVAKELGEGPEVSGHA